MSNTAEREFERTRNAAILKDRARYVYFEGFVRGFDRTDEVMRTMLNAAGQHDAERLRELALAFVSRLIGVSYPDNGNGAKDTAGLVTQKFLYEADRWSRLPGQPAFGTDGRNKDGVSDVVDTLFREADLTAIGHGYQEAGGRLMEGFLDGMKQHVDMRYSSPRPAAK